MNAPGCARHLVLALATAGFAAAAAASQVESPGGSVLVSIGVDDNGAIEYQVRHGDELLVAPSRLGLQFVSAPGFEDGLRLTRTERGSADSSWEQPWGERRIVRDRYNELLASFRSTSGPDRRIDVRIRVYDDGLGFRYELPAQPHLDRVAIADELTEFRLPADAEAFWQPGSDPAKYEVLYRTTALGDMQNAHTPVTLRLASGTHVSIHEAALVDYSAFTLDQPEPGTLRTTLRPWSDGVRVRSTAPMRSPWRSIQIAPSAAGLLESSLILNLNEPNALGDASWVEPGKYVGIWWEIHLGHKTWQTGPDHAATTAAAKRAIDFAAANGFSGVLVEGWNRGWNADEPYSFIAATPDFDIEAVARYGLGSGVRLIGHHETFADVPAYEQAMAAAFEFYAKLGVRQVKTGYVGLAGQLRRVDDDGRVHREWHDGQFAAAHQLRVLREAAEHRISINTHEPVKDTGLRRTYPNWLTREGARGQEYAVWGERPNPPEHTVMLAFTRMLAGPLDFTPGIFDLDFEINGKPRRVQTTLAKQLALYVVLYSPVQMVPDLQANYARFPDAFRFIVDVPTDWEETVGVAGEVGDYVAVARQQRGGDDWYLGAISDEQARDLNLPLSFLDADRAYTATIYRDGEHADWDTNPYAYLIEERDVDRDGALNVRLAAGGGAAIRFRPKTGAGQ